ncbi:MAG TPA: branched-chain amino acid ABC transporter permease, partial [bacterium]|nr:branched-chain amino acid ABC transporter permease [bacterium]
EGRALRAAWVIAGLALALLPVAHVRYLTSTLTEVLIFALFAMSLGLLVGYAGLVSLGHAAFFGTAAYAVALVSTRVSPALLITLPAGVAVGTLTALAIGVFALRATGVSFLMLTLAFAQMAYAVAHQWSWLTGGTNGLSGIPRPTIPGVDFGGAVPFYYLVLLVVGAAALVLQRIVASPFGAALIGVRENEPRMRAMGFDTFRLKLAAFVLAGATAALSGVLYAYYNGFVSPDELYWTRSGEVLVMVLLGGAGTLIGPAVGAGVVLILQNLVSSVTERWTMILGAAFILVVLVAPRGLAGLLSWRWARSSSPNA